MEKLITEFGMNYGEFSGIIRLFNARVCGESALYAYLCDNMPDNPPQWMPDNICIYMPTIDKTFIDRHATKNDIELEIIIDDYNENIFRILNRVFNHYNYYSDVNWVSTSRTQFKYCVNEINYHNADKTRVFRIILYNTELCKEIHENRTGKLSVQNITWTPDNIYQGPLQDANNMIAYLTGSHCKDTISWYKSRGFRVFEEL